jgi:hypothetical protein
MNGHCEAVFQLGDVAVRLSKVSAQVSRRLSQLLPAGDANCPAADIDLEVDSVQTALELAINVVVNSRQGNLWFDAAAVISPFGKKALIAGRSQAGKTSLSIALAMHGWKVVSEDLTFIDSQQRQILPLTVPLSVRPYTVEKLNQSFGNSPSLFDDSWFFPVEAFLNRPVDLPVDAVMLLQPVDPRQNVPLETGEISPGEMLRSLLSISSILRVPGAVSFMNAQLEKVRCLSVNGGSLKDRLQALEDMLA